MKLKKEIYLLRAIHVLITLALIASIVYIYYIELLKLPRNNYFYLAVILLLAEGAALLLNQGLCPLNFFHQKYNDHKDLWLVFLPKSVAKYAMRFFIFAAIIAGILILNNCPYCPHMVN